MVFGLVKRFSMWGVVYWRMWLHFEFLFWRQLVNQLNSFVLKSETKEPKKNKKKKKNPKSQGNHLAYALLDWCCLTLIEVLICSVSLKNDIDPYLKRLEQNFKFSVLQYKSSFDVTGQPSIIYPAQLKRKEERKAEMQWILFSSAINYL